MQMYNPMMKARMVYYDRYERTVVNEMSEGITVFKSMLEYEFYKILEQSPLIENPTNQIDYEYPLKFRDSSNKIKTWKVDFRVVFHGTTVYLETKSEFYARRKQFRDKFQQVVEVYPNIILYIVSRDEFALTTPNRTFNALTFTEALDTLKIHANKGRK